MAKTIMIVDDEPLICKAVKDLLSINGFNVITASGGKDALRKLKRKKVDLVLVDFFMPEMSGRELCEEIRKDKDLKDLKLAFLTIATFSQSGYKELKRMKILDYIKKPFENKDLVARVKKLSK